MSKEKIETQAKESIEARVTTLEKQGNATAYVVRKIKNWLEEKHGADIDGDGEVGGRMRGLAGKLGLVLVLSLSCVATSLGAQFALFSVAKDPRANPYPFTVGTNGITYAEDLTVSNSITVPTLTITSGTTLPAGDIVRADLATTGDGVVSGEVATVVEAVAEMKSTVITFTNVVLIATDTSDEGESQEVYVFDDGAFTLLGAVIDASVISSPGATGATVYVAVGTTAAQDDADLTGTEADIIPRTTLDTATASTNDFDAILATNIIFDGTSTAIRIHVNFAIADDQMNADVTNTFTGTLTLYYTKPVDNQ